jgi:hypothetical protein
MNAEGPTAERSTIKRPHPWKRAERHLRGRPRRRFVGRGAGVELLVDGVQFMPAIEQALRAAKR